MKYTNILTLVVAALTLAGTLIFRNDFSAFAQRAEIGKYTAMTLLGLGVLLKYGKDNSYDNNKIWSGVGIIYFLYGSFHLVMNITSSHTNEVKTFAYSLFLQVLTFIITLWLGNVIYREEDKTLTPAKNK